MATNTHEVRKVRTFAVDLCIGDIVVDEQRRYVGVVDGTPEMAHGIVTLELSTGVGLPEVRRWRDSRAVWIEIPRRLR